VHYRSPAMKRYTKRLAVCLAFYIVLIFGVGYIFRIDPPLGAAAWVLASLPALPILGVFWTIFRLLAEESDEYMRHRLIRQVLFATSFCLCIMTVWEFLQNYDVVSPGTGGFGTAFFWFVGLGLGAIGNSLVARREALEE
jgi:hypothetical protein